MAKDLHEEYKVKSKLLVELQQILDAKMEAIGKLELDMTAKIEQVRILEQSLGEKTAKANELQAELDKKTAVIELLEGQVQSAQSKVQSAQSELQSVQNEMLQYKAEIESIKKLLSYRLGRCFGKVFGAKQDPDISKIDEQSNLDSGKPAAQAPDIPADDPGPEPKTVPPNTVPPNTVPPNTVPPNTVPPNTESNTAPEPITEPDLYEALKLKLSAHEKANLISSLRQRLASTKFTHGEDLSISPSLLELCIDSRSNMLGYWDLVCLCLCIKNFAWNQNDYLIEIGTNIGQGAVFMAKVFKELKLNTRIVSIDPFSSAAKKTFNPQGSYSHYLTLTRQQDAQDLCIPVTAFSQQIHNIFKENVGVLVVDGSHQYEDVRKDLDFYCQTVKLNGYIFVDDVASKVYPGVYGAFEEWLASHSDFELSYQDESFAVAKRISIAKQV